MQEQGKENKGLKTAHSGAKGNNSEFPALSKRQKQFLPLFLELKNISQTCRVFELDRKTFYSWMKQPAFAAELDRLQVEQIAEAVALIKMHTISAAEKLVALMNSKDESIQVKASKAVLDYYQRNIESAELDRRLSALESVA